jgi:hypothetical protein
MTLFETRGGSLKRHRCEICDEPLDPESPIPVCESCAWADLETIED